MVRPHSNDQTPLPWARRLGFLAQQGARLGAGVAALSLALACGQAAPSPKGAGGSEANGPTGSGGSTSETGPSGSGGQGGLGGQGGQGGNASLGPVERDFRDVSSKHPLAMNEWLAGSGSDLAKQQDGTWWRLHIPASTGPGLQIWVSDPAVDGGRFVNRTKAMLPSAAGFPMVLASGLFIDLNNDGWDDILLLRDKSSFDAKGYLFDPSTQTFDALPFNVDHDNDNTVTDGIASFFGNKDVSYHTRSARRVDLDGDGDDDLFVARRFGNYIFENLSNKTSWTINDCLQSGTIVQRFKRHVVDRLAIDLQAQQNTWIINEIGETSAHTLVRIDANKPLMVAAADGVCSGSYCADGRGQGPQRMLHLYGLRTAATGCAPSNGFCEEGEMAKNDPDCVGNYAPVEELSCTFFDHLRRPIAGMNAASIVAADVTGDGTANDLLVFGTASTGPNPGPKGENSEILLAMKCAVDATGCQTLTTLGPSLLFNHQDGFNYAGATPLAAPFNAPYQMIDAATAVDSNGDGKAEVAVFAGRTPFGTRQLHLFEAKAGKLVEVSNSTSEQDYDRSIQGMHAADLNGNGSQDIVVTNIRGQRIFQGSLNANPPQLRLDRRLPSFSQNMGPPVLVDVDNDGHLDIVVKTWADTEQDKALMLLLRNDGTGSFTLVPNSFDGLPVGFGGKAVALDYDQDGDMDLVATQSGPMLLLENRHQQGETLTFVQRSDLLPPYYASGGTVHGRTIPSCEPNKASSLGGGHCGTSRLAVRDVNGDGKPDLLIVQRKGSNDVLLNNVDGATCAANAPGCARTGFLSARSDLGIVAILGANEVSGAGSNNRAERVYATGPLLGDGTSTVVVLSAPFVDTTTPTDALYVNGITAAVPHATFCQSANECATNETCSPANGYPLLKVCREGLKQKVVGGWFEKYEGAFPLRGGVSPVAPYALLGCSAVGDINGDGHLDVALTSNVAETYPDLNNKFVLRFDNSKERCSLFEGETEYTTCDVYFQCNENRCEVHNPLGLGVGGPSQVFPDTDSRCCTETLVTAPLKKPACLGYGRSHPDRCSIRGYLYYNEKTELRERLTDVFFYLWNPQTKRFDEYQHPLDVGEISGSELFGCALSDLDRDGDLDFAVTGYVTGALPEQLLKSRQLLSGPFYARRRRFKAINTSVWLNPDWSEPGQLGKAFKRGSLTIRGGKDYGLTIGDVDGDQLEEILLNDANGLQLFDDPAP